MKKLFYLLIGILLMPMIAKADMASPMVIKYDASVTNPDGVYLYEYKDGNFVKSDKKLPYGTIIKDIMEDSMIKVDGSLIKNTDSKKSYYVNPSLLTATKDEYNITSTGLEEKEEGFTLVDVDIKKGPAAAYPSTGTIIKAGTKISLAMVKVIDDEAEDEDDYSSGAWYYVEYNGIKGFVDTYDGPIVFGSVSEKELITAGKTEIIDPKTKQVLKTIEPSTKIKAKIGNLGLWSRNSYIEYDGVKGIADTYYLVPKDTEDKYKFDHDMKIYDTVYVGDTISGNVIGILPANTTFKSRYMADYDYVYYESGTIKGWINESGYDYESEQDKIDNNEDVKKEVENEEIKEIIAPKKDYTIYYCIGGAVLLAVISSISIILVNKSRKNK